MHAFGVRTAAPQQPRMDQVLLWVVIEVGHGEKIVHDLLHQVVVGPFRPFEPVNLGGKDVEQPGHNGVLGHEARSWSRDMMDPLFAMPRQSSGLTGKGFDRDQVAGVGRKTGCIALAGEGIEICGGWRRGRDSNPRYGFKPYTPLAGERLQPLGHLSTAVDTGEFARIQRFPSPFGNREPNASPHTQITMSWDGTPRHLSSNGFALH